MSLRDAGRHNSDNDPPTPDSKPEPNYVTRSGVITCVAIGGGTVATASAWAIGPALAVAVGIFAALGAAAAVHELLPRHWR